MGEGWLGDRDSDVLGDRSGRGGKSLPRPRPGGRAVVAVSVGTGPRLGDGRPWGKARRGGPAPIRDLAWGLLVADGRN